MAVKIRLRRMGQKKAPFYRICVGEWCADSSRRSEHTILITILAPTMLTRS